MYLMSLQGTTAKKSTEGILTLQGMLLTKLRHAILIQPEPVYTWIMLQLFSKWPHALFFLWNLSLVQCRELRATVHTPQWAVSHIIYHALFSAQHRNRKPWSSHMMQKRNWGMARSDGQNLPPVPSDTSEMLQVFPREIHSSVLKHQLQ